VSEGSDGRLSQLFCALLHFAIIGSYKHTYLIICYKWTRAFGFKFLYFFVLSSSSTSW